MRDYTKASDNFYQYFIMISAKSQLREVMDDLTKRSKVKLNYELPDDVIEDYTYEIGRLKFKVSSNLDLGTKLGEQIQNLLNLNGHLSKTNILLRQ